MKKLISAILLATMLISLGACTISTVKYEGPSFSSENKEIGVYIVDNGAKSEGTKLFTATAPKRCRLIWLKTKRKRHSFLFVAIRKT